MDGGMGRGWCRGGDWLGVRQMVGVPVLSLNLGWVLYILSYTRMFQTILQFYDLLWPSISFYSFLLACVLEHSTSFCNLLSCSIRFYHFPRCSVGFHGIPWGSRMFYNLPYASITFYQVPCFFLWIWSFTILSYLSLISSYLSLSYLIFLTFSLSSLLLASWVLVLGYSWWLQISKRLSSCDISSQVDHVAVQQLMLGIGRPIYHYQSNHVFVVLSWAWWSIRKIDIKKEMKY